VAGALNTQRTRIQSVERAAAILRLLAAAPQGCSVAAAAQALGLPKGTAHGILRTLVLESFAEQDPDSGKYRIGRALVPMGLAYLNASRLRAAVLHPAETLARLTGESVHVATLCDLRALIIHHVPRAAEGQRTVDTGRLEPLHATALGKALLAFDPSVLADLDPLAFERFTPATVTDPDDLGRGIVAVSGQGWASEISEFSVGFASIAAPIGDSRTADAIAIGIEGRADRICENGAPRPRLVAAVTESARTCARLLGYRVWPQGISENGRDSSDMIAPVTRDEARVTPVPHGRG